MSLENLDWGVDWANVSLLVGGVYVGILSSTLIRKYTNWMDFENDERSNENLHCYGDCEAEGADD